MADDPGSQGFPSPKGAVRCQIQPIRPGMRTWPHAAVRAWPKPTSQGRGGCPLGLARSAEVVLCHEKEPRGGAREAATARLVAGRGQPAVAAAEGGRLALATSAPTRMRQGECTQWLALDTPT